ncbi:hypothetical protein GJ744_000337 [Endocarpon pusillum]|uniref:Uncharacterized protein n=1 Tax=Endocarpon pusillum TaxID=364733 RepID=A0A8H7E8V7_9EURO|nr:hypothetical protein GJ744_000337 [Endocarpon pusillum]
MPPEGSATEQQSHDLNHAGALHSHALSKNPHSHQNSMSADFKHLYAGANKEQGSGPSTSLPEFPERSSSCRIQESGGSMSAHVSGVVKNGQHHGSSSAFENKRMCRWYNEDARAQPWSAFRLDTSAAYGGVRKDPYRKS